MPRFRLDPFAPSGISRVSDEQSPKTTPERRTVAPLPPVRLVTLDPGSAVNGELIYNMVDSLLKIWTGNGWTTITGSGTSGPGTGVNNLLVGAGENLLIGSNEVLLL